MKVLITGGSGFLAAWVIRRLLASGHQVRVLDRNGDRRTARSIVGDAIDGVEWQVGDVTQRADVDRAIEGCDVALSLAALLTPACRADPVVGAQVNLIGVLNVFEAAKRAGHMRVVYASSAGVFGADDGVTPRPTTHYGAFKLACEGCARSYWEDDRIASVGFRPFVIYGPGREVGSSAGPTLACRAAAEGKPFEIAYTGDSDLLYVEDAAAAFAAAITHDYEGAHVFNLLGEVASVEAVIAEIRTHVPDARLSAAGAPLPITAHIAPNGVERLFHNLPHTDLKTGLARTIQHYRPASAQPTSPA